MRYASYGAGGMVALAMLCAVAAAATMGIASPSGCGQFAWNCVSVYGAPPCMAPGYGSMGLGCYPPPAPSCCDHIWDGYCCERWCWRRCYRPCGPAYCGPVTGTVCITNSASCSPSGVVVSPVEQPATVGPLESISPQLAPKPATAVQSGSSQTSGGR